MAYAKLQVVPKYNCLFCFDLTVQKTMTAMSRWLTAIHKKKVQ